jgi:hypothetical protein
MALPVSQVTLSDAEGAIIAKNGAVAGQAFLAFAAANPAYTPEEAALVFEADIAAKGLATAIAEASGTLGTAIGQSAPADVGKAVSPIGTAISSVPGFLSFITQRDFLIRVAEGVLGLALIVVAIAKLADGTAAGRAAGNIAKKAALT